MKIGRTFAAIALAIFATAATAQFPSKPIRIVVSVPAGSGSDTVARILGASVSKSVGQPVLIENKVGADGQIAAMETVKAAPDGYTVLLGTPGPIASVPALRKNPGYDPLVDLTPITDLGRFTLFLYVHPSVPANTFAELVAYAKKNPGKLTYGTGNTSGIASFAQMNKLAGIEMLHVPYKGEPPAITDLVAGRIHLLWATPTTGLAHTKDGRLRALVTSLKERSKLLPDVPTINEAGLPTFTINSFGALYGPAKMPRDVVDVLNREFVAAIKRPEVFAALEKHIVPISSTPEELARFTQEQVVDWRRILREAGIQPE
jgi:tripartite-type tricarboxylate transporter receptor subunit TctC